MGYLARAFNPAERRDERGRWSTLEAVKNALEHHGGNDEGALDLGDGKYIDWSSNDDTVGGDRYLEMKDGDGNNPQIELNAHEFRAFANALAATHMLPHVNDQHAALLHATNDIDHMPLEDGRVLDWSTPLPGGGRRFEIDEPNGGEAAMVDLTAEQFNELVHSVAITAAQDRDEQVLAFD